MKKFLALLLALVMVFALAACGGGDDPVTTDPAGTTDPGTTETDPAATEPAEAGTNPDDIPDTMESEDNTYEIAFVTDVGQLKDKSFNEGTWNGVKTYAYENNLSYKYYQPANGGEATDTDRYDAMKQAVDNGASVVVCVGFLQENAIRQAAAEFTDVHFIFIDGSAVKVDPDNTADDAEVFANTVGVLFREEQCGYLAGYAVVKEGYTQIGFASGGGGTNPACCRYGYGYLQGASAAAEELGVTVDVMYSWQYGGTFSASPELQTMINGWYVNGTEVVFACGGSMFSSITAAAGANDGIVIGVDVDQSPLSDTVITSALKGISQAAQVALGHHYDGTWSEIGGVQTTLGANDDAVGLPTATWSMENYTVEEYEAQLAAMKDGSLVVDANYPVDENNMDATATLNGVLPNLNITVV